MLTHAPALTMENSTVSVLIGRFEDIVNRGLCALVGEDASIAVVASDIPPAQLRVALEKHRPAVAIVNFGTLPSPLFVHELHKALPETRLVLLANHPSPAECNQMLSLGATACLSKETQARDILNAIHLASRGMHVLPRTAAEFGMAQMPHASELLTAREADVLELLETGKSNAEIALALQVSAETVKTHVRNIYRKLGVRTRRELAGLLGSPSRLAERLEQPGA